MTSIFVLIAFILGVGLFARKYDGWTRLLLIFGIGGIVLYLSLR